MMHTHKEFRVFKSGEVLCLRPVDRRSLDKGEALSSIFGPAPANGVIPHIEYWRGVELLCSHICRRAWLVAVLSLILMTSPSIYRTVTQQAAPTTILFVSVGAALVLIYHLLQLPNTAITDCKGNIVDLATRTLKTKEGVEVRLGSGDDHGK